MFSRASTALLFPFYLLPSPTFQLRRTRSSCAYPDANEAKQLDESYFKGYGSHLRCARCAADICLTSQIISKGFTGRHGRAYLVSPSIPLTMEIPVVPRNTHCSLPNTKTDTPSKRQLVTGIHTVCDVRCSFCGSMLGWKYDGAEEESQKYKVGKYILETKMVCTSSNWDLGGLDALPRSPLSNGSGRTAEYQRAKDVEFDSQDEEECEDLFAGEWNPSVAAKRKQARRFRAKVLDEVEKA